MRREGKEAKALGALPEVAALWRPKLIASIVRKGKDGRGPRQIQALTTGPQAVPQCGRLRRHQRRGRQRTHQMIGIRGVT